MLRKIGALMVLAGAWAALLAPAALAHSPGEKVTGRCSITENVDQGQVVVEVENISGETIKNVEAAPLAATNIGTASLFIVTSPRPLRELLGGKTGVLKWKVRFYGNGYLDLSLAVKAEAQDGHIDTTGVINCNRVTVGDPSSLTPRATSTPRDTPTARPVVDTPTPLVIATRTRRPTQTPRPTRTPRGFGATPTARSTSTPRDPTRTPRTPLATRTSPPPPPTRTPRTPLASPTPRIPLATRTPMLGRPTKTPRPTRTSRSQPQPTPTARPTRTPEGSSFEESGLRAHCSLRRNIDAITIDLVVENHTGATIRTIETSQLELAPEGGALFFDRAGPSPSLYTRANSNTSVSFQFTGRLSPGGTMGFSVSAHAKTPDNRVISTGLVDCGTTTAEGGNTSPSDFTGSCTIHDGDPGGIDFAVRNGTRVSITDVVPVLKARSTTGSAQVSHLSGPVPNSTRRLSNAQQIVFQWRARIVGRGGVSMQFEASSTLPSGERISTGAVTCTREVNTIGNNLPDLTISETDLRNSLEIHTENFRSDDCAIDEGCVDGPGTRRLLRFDTVTPNLGPGDVFIGDPGGNNNFIFSQCHAHFHFENYADYRLLDMEGNLVRLGHKQAFCLVDLFRMPDGNGSVRPQFPDCGFQGISAGWADIYNRGLDCQWVDITGVPEGRYVLEVVVNPARVIEEGNYSNNAARTEVFIPRP